jgi:hypothetical protein
LSLADAQLVELGHFCTIWRFGVPELICTFVITSEV